MPHLLATQAFDLFKLPYNLEVLIFILLDVLPDDVLLPLAPWCLLPLLAAAPPDVRL